MTTLASLEGVSRRFGDVLALDQVDLTITAGEILGLLGPNGAGKTTLLSLLTGQRQPSTGTVKLFGSSPRDWRTRKRLGSTPQESALPATLRVGEVIDFVGRHFDERVTVPELADQFGLTNLLSRQTGSLSGGQKRRVSVALAFVGKPRLVLLDEPTTGLDVDARRTLWAALRERHEAGVTVVVTSHYLEEIEALADRAVVVAAGKIIADDRIGTILERVGVRQIRLKTSQPERVAALPGVLGIDHGTTQPGIGVPVTLYAQDSDAVIVELVRSGCDFTDLAVRGATLEEAFLALTESLPQTDSSRQDGEAL